MILQSNCKFYCAGICDVTNMVNDIYGLHLLFCSANFFVSSVTRLFNFYVKLFIMNNNALLLILAVILIVYAMQFFLIWWICTLTREESNRNGRIIYKIILNCKPVNFDEHEASNQLSLEERTLLEVSNSE